MLNPGLNRVIDCGICDESVYLRTVKPCANGHRLVCNTCVAGQIWQGEEDRNALPYHVAHCNQCNATIYDLGIGPLYNPHLLNTGDIRDHEDGYAYDEFAGNIFNLDGGEPYGAVVNIGDVVQDADLDWPYNPFQGMLDRLQEEGLRAPRIDDAGNDIHLCKLAVAMRSPGTTACFLTQRLYGLFVLPFRQCRDGVCGLEVREPFRVSYVDDSPHEYYNSVFQNVNNTPVNFVAVEQFPATPIVSATAFSWIHDRFSITVTSVPEYMQALRGVDLGYLTAQGYTHMRDVYIYPDVFKYQDEEKAGVHARISNHNAFLQVLCDVFCPRGYQKHVIEDTLLLWMQYRAWRTYVFNHHTIPAMVKDDHVPYMTQSLN